MSGDEKKTSKVDTGATLDATRLDGVAVDLESTDFATEEIPVHEARRLESGPDEPWTDEVTSPGDAKPSVLPELDDDPPTQQVEINITPSRYEVLDTLGLLGMGEVLRVRDRELERVVDMTVMHRRFLASPRSMMKFRSGILVAAKLRHPGITPVHDIGVLPDGRVYFTSGTVRGATLAARRKDPSVPQKRLVLWFQRVAEAVAHAHHEGVVHGWLSPQVVRVGELGQLTVGGWGARPAAPERSYTAPELLRGQHLEPTPASDVYALGAILYFLLAGTPPGPADTAFRPPSELSEAPVGAPLESLCRRSLSARIAERPSSAVELCRELRIWLERS